MLAHGSQHTKKAICAAGALPLVIECLRSGNPGVQEEAAAALSELASHGHTAEAIWAAGAVPWLVEGFEVWPANAAGSCSISANKSCKRTLAGRLPTSL